jgi:hypothetical protein
VVEAGESEGKGLERAEWVAEVEREDILVHASELKNDVVLWNKTK